MFIIKNRKIFFSISSILMIASVFAIFFYGINFSIDFTGGAITEIEYTEGRAELSLVKEKLDILELGNYSIQESGDAGIILRTKDLTEPERLDIMNALSLDGDSALKEKRYNSIGPVIGEELKNKAWVAMLLVIMAIILFVAFAFRHVTDTGSKSISSWKYGLVAIMALVHDILIPTGIFIYLGSLFITYQVDALFITALLAILGYSVNDTIVVFDRVRENLKTSKKGESFEDIVGKSLTQTIARSVNTSLTTLVVLGFLFFIGGETTKQFALVLAIGVMAGTYSSIFLASPLLVTLQKLRDK